MRERPRVEKRLLARALYEECLRRSRLKSGPLADRTGERAIDDVGGIEPLLDQARAKIEIDGLLFIGDDAILDQRQANPSAPPAN